MDRIALQILEDGWEQDGLAMRRAVGRRRVGDRADLRLRWNPVFPQRALRASKQRPRAILESTVQQKPEGPESSRARSSCPCRPRSRLSRSETSYQTA